MTLLNWGETNWQDNGVPASSENEIPTGVIDGKNCNFTLLYAPVPASLQLFKNGLIQHVRPGGNCTINGNVITFLPTTTPIAGQWLLAWYRCAQPTAT